MLGHLELRITQIEVKGIVEKKRESANKMDLG
jgi:hypothetical protein